MERFQEKGKKSKSTATLAAWYRLDFDQNRMTPLLHQLVGNVSTNIVEEYDAVCEGY
jgi:hypothetical protein